MTKDKLLELYEFESISDTIYRKPNKIDFFYICDNNYRIEIWTGDSDYDYDYESKDLSIESLKNFLIDIYSDYPIKEYRRKKLERICT